jgi:hypothetical protein
MRIRIVFSLTSETRISPPFEVMPAQVDFFIDKYLSGIENMSWNSSVSFYKDRLKVFWFSDPPNPQDMVEEIEGGLNMDLPHYSSWKSIK